jgi:hypothetical protein
METFICDNCKQLRTNTSTFSTGYGRNAEGEKICFECCGLHDNQALRALKPGESMHLYFTKGELINWPGSFRIKPYAVTHGRHNIGRVRTDAWFKFNHHEYHGVQIGVNNEVMRVTRVKK